MAEFTTLQEMLLIAHDKLESGVWDFINGGTELEATLRRNRHGLDRLAFRQRVLSDVSRIDTSTTFLGHKLALPVMMAPVGSLALIDPAAAVSVAGACKAFGSLLIYSTFADPPLDVVRAKVDHPLILGLYVRGDQAWLDQAIDQAKAAGCVAITVVTEAPYYSRRERDLINKFRSRGSKSGTYASTQKILRVGGSDEAVAAAEARMVTARLTWKTIERIRTRSSLPVILKGISTAEDARLAVEHGVSAVYISNHGGRQLDCARGSIEVLPEIVEAVGGKAEVIMDGGIYRGTDVLKAIALGARAVCLGRLQCWALAAGGETGLVQMLENPGGGDHHRHGPAGRDQAVRSPPRSPVRNRCPRPAAHLQPVPGGEGASCPKRLRGIAPRSSLKAAAACRCPSGAPASGIDTRRKVFQGNAEVERQDALIVAGSATLAGGYQLAQLRVDACHASELAFVQTRILDLAAVVGQHEIGRRYRLIRNVQVIVERDCQTAWREPVCFQRRAAGILDGASGDHHVGAAHGGFGAALVLDR